MVPKMANGVNLPPFPNHDQHNEEAISYLRDNTVESIIDAFIETRKELIKRISEIEEDARFTIGEGKRQFSCESYKYICKTRHSSFATNTCKIK